MVLAVIVQVGRRVAHVGASGGAAATVGCHAVRYVAILASNTATPAIKAATGCGRPASPRAIRPGHASAHVDLLASASTWPATCGLACALHRWFDGDIADASGSALRVRCDG
jgi:hypothetical protein